MCDDGNMWTHDRHGVVGCGDTVLVQVLGLRLMKTCKVLAAIKIIIQVGALWSKKTAAVQ